MEKFLQADEALQNQGAEGLATYQELVEEAERLVQQAQRLLAAESAAEPVSEGEAGSSDPAPESAAGDGGA